MPVAKIKAFLLHLYPELGRFNPFKQIEVEILLRINPQMKKILRVGLPIFTLVIIFGIGLPIGSLILRLVNQKQIAPPSIEVKVPSAAPTYQSEFLPIKRAIEEFSPSLPDPIPPVLDQKISLEPLE